jgi:hypothetical protein
MTDRIGDVDAAWPTLLPLQAWQNTCTTLHIG